MAAGWIGLRPLGRLIPNVVHKKCLSFKMGVKGQAEDTAAPAAPPQRRVESSNGATTISPDSAARCRSGFP
ncbi:hypothetical protein Pen02_51380 [Plantactinospora endophytica]|uniref:Uncharacterized protein n=1 Tax=Plantactinospora endophytica TaxID=673535 RepID=A0ABQ4E664_9ACTN|nr:hypothetical protein Pen02_51380 [Plantactinospora endophytica]